MAEYHTNLPQLQFNMPFEFSIINIPVVPTPVAYRPIAEDSAVVNSIFGAQEYQLPHIENYQPKLILDCGGNIGCAAVYFANKYPDAQIYSIEPEMDNFKLLTFNTAFYENIHPIKSALLDKETFRTTTVSKLLADSGFDEIDLLKIDIEGAEKEVFAAPDVDDWLSKVKVLVIELHDRMKLGCSDEFFKAISKYKWYFAFRGENLIFIRESLMLK